MQQKEQTISTPEGEIVLSTGKFAKLAQGSVVARKGGTVIFAACTYEGADTDADFFPLTVEYLERMYAVGTISGSRVNKREGFPSEGAIIKARQVDHTIRPLFPKHFRRRTNVILTVLANDGVNDPEQLTVLAASAAITMSGIPFAGPAASVIVAVDANGKLIVNPPKDASHNHDEFLGEFAVSAANGKVLNIEGWGKELSDAQMDQIMDLALERIAHLNQEQAKFTTGLIAAEVDYSKEDVVPSTLVDKIKSDYSTKLEQVLYTADKAQRDAGVAQLTEELCSLFVTDDGEFSKPQVMAAVDYVSQQKMRETILAEEKRFSGRSLVEIRQLAAEVDILPTVHGSALFSRGLTQSLSITTLAALSKGQTLNDMTGQDEMHRFMHHYSFPSYSTGEAGRVQYKPGRREIGHGAIGLQAIKHLLPSEEEFPYSIRVVSEIMTSNGSTSMAATCATSLSLMAAGVPLKKAVAGIGVGLVTADEGQEKYKLLLDIEGVEDFFGDMDFKVTGTDSGVTAIQFETKLQGVKPEILKQAFRLANEGRQQVLQAMNSAISAPRAELAANAPRVEAVHISPEYIGAIIGPGGKHIKELIENAETLGGIVEIDIEDDGRIMITASNKEQLDYVKAQIADVAMEPEVGAKYDGVVDSVMPYGAFVNVGSRLSGLVHVSEMSDEFVKDPNTIVKVGDKVRVKLIGTEKGKLSFSMKQARD